MNIKDNIYTRCQADIKDIMGIQHIFDIQDIHNVWAVSLLPCGDWLTFLIGGVLLPMSSMIVANFGFLADIRTPDCASGKALFWDAVRPALEHQTESIPHP